MVFDDYNYNMMNDNMFNIVKSTQQTEEDDADNADDALKSIEDLQAPPVMQKESRRKIFNDDDI